MKQFNKYSRKLNLLNVADYSGLIAACMCFIHCWTLPVLVILLPGLINNHNWVHPVLCSVAIISTLPMMLKKKFINQDVLFQFSVGFGNLLMLIILLAHDHLSFTVELMLNTIGGSSLIYVHYSNMKMKKRVNENIG